MARPNGLLIVLLVAFAAQARAQGHPAAPAHSPDQSWDPLFVGYQSEPAMDFGGRTVVSLQDAISRGIGSIGKLGTRHPRWAPVWEFPVAMFLEVLQHEVMGHGGRAWEFGLSPGFTLGPGFHASTSTRYPPRTNEEGALFFAGGTEAGGVLAHDVLLDLLRPEGADGAKLPLAIWSKLDLTMYAARTHGPGDRTFEGGDLAVYLAWSQSQRLGTDPLRHRYQPDFSDPLLDADWSAVRRTAVWNAIDPSLVAATFAYFRDHVVDGRVRVHAPVLKITDAVGLTIGTRAALGPAQVSRFLDLYATTRWGVASAYVRDLHASTSRTFGYGAAVHAVRVGTRFSVSFATDTWTDPAGAKVRADGRGWHVAGDIDARLTRRCGLSVKLGSKSRGFFPGLPLADGPYGGLGMTTVW